jgi:Carboxypeptidase regulatory-like domain
MNKANLKWLLCRTLIMAGILGGQLAQAQQSVVGATVSGVVHDASRAIVRDAEVNIRNQATGQSWRVLSDRNGGFRFSYLPAGSYRLRVQANGFGPAEREVALLVGQAFDLQVVLNVANLEQQVTVSEEPPLVETVRTQLSEVVTPREINTLPLNGRNYLDLALLVPGVSKTNTGANQRFAETSAVPGTGISVYSQRNLNNSFVLDGLSANDDAAELAGSFYSQEVIREFQVVTSDVAEFGRASAGVVNIITQSGSNTLHGTAYGFLRNQRFDAKNPLSGTLLPLTQVQYGLSLSGPIVRDRTFYFGNFEQTRQNTAGVITIDPTNVAAINTRLDAVNYPGARIQTGSFPTGLDTSNVFLRLDHDWRPAIRSTLRYSFYDVSSENARNVGGLNAVSRAAGLENRDQTIAASNTWSISPRLLNESRFQFTRSRLDAPVNDLIGPAVNIAGVANFGTATFSPTGRDIDLFEGVNNLSIERGRHSVKTGVDYLQNRVTITFPGALQGVYTFSSLANFNSGNYVNFQQAFGVPSTFQNNPNIGWFVEDEWRAMPGLTFNGGVRYDLQFLAGPVETDSNNISPRIGIAWDPWHNGKTVVRANYGIFYDRIPLRALANALQRDGIQYSVALVTPATAGAPLFPNTLAAFPAGLLTNITTIDPLIENSYSQQASLQIERSITSKLALSVGYEHLRGRHLIMSRNINVPTTTNPAVFNLGRPDPTVANNGQFQSIGDSWYDGLTLSVNQRASTWGSFRLSYTYSKALDTSGNFFFSSPQDNFNILADKGLSDNDQRHRISFSGTLNSRARGADSFVGSLSRGWVFAYIYTYTSTLPFNILAGADLNGDTNPNDRPPGVGRNTGVGFGFSSLDLRLSRRFPIGDRWGVEAMAEAFNILNQRNDMLPNNVFGTGSVPRSTFGQPTAVGDPRQIQLGLRVNF